MRRRSFATLLVVATAIAACKAPEGSALRKLDDGDAGFEVAVDGNETFDDRDLVKQVDANLLDFIDSEYRKFAVDDAAFQLQVFYQDRGFPHAQVEYEVAEGPNGPYVQFNVVEGTRTEYDGAEFDGVSHFEADELARLVPVRGSGFLALGPTWLVMSRLDAGRGLIEGLYYESGFLEVEVERLDVDYRDGGELGIARYRVEEGPRYLLDSVHVSGLPVVWPREVVRKAWSESIDTPWFPRVGYEVRARVEGLCADRGYPDAKAKAEVKQYERLEDGKPVVRVVLLVSIDIGTRVTVRSVTVRGNEKTRTAFIRNRLKLQPGDPYSQKRVDEAFKALYRTGIFEQLRIRLVKPLPDAAGAPPAEGSPAPEGTSEPEGRDIVIEVVEGPKWEFWAQPGWGSYEKLRLSAGFLDRNVFGTGRQLSGEASVSVLAQNGQLQFTEPTLLGPDNTLRFELYGLHRIEPSFTRVDLGTGVQVRREWTPFLDTIVRYDLRRTQSKDVQTDTPGDPATEDSTVDLSLVTLSANYDRRDSKFLPRHGSLSRGAIEVSNDAIGSEINYLRLLGSHFRYTPLGERTTLATGLRTGLLLARDDVVFPIQLRFFNGGENTVRSFREQQLGPKDSDGNPIGGEVFSVFNVELRRQLISQFQGAVFFDAGNVLVSSRDYFSFADIRTGVGAGLRWLLPIGPVRLDFAVNPDPEPDEAHYVVHFSLGVAF